MSNKYSKRTKADPTERYIRNQAYKHSDLFFRAFDSLLYDEKFLRLSNGAKALYIYIGLKCTHDSEAPRRYCTFQKAEYHKAITKNDEGFRKYLTELLTAGFIQIGSFRDAQRRNVYRLSDNWKRYESVPTEEQYFQRE